MSEGIIARFPQLGSVRDDRTRLWKSHVDVCPTTLSDLRRALDLADDLRQLLESGVQ